MRAQDRYVANPEQRPVSHGQPLRPARNAEPEGRDLGTGIEREDGGLRLLDAKRIINHRSHVENLAWQGNLDRADRLAGIARETETLRPGYGIKPMVKTGDDQPDGAGVDVPERMSPHLAIGRTNVGAGGATDTVQRLSELRQARHGSPAIVHQHNVHLMSRRRTSRECGVAGDALRSSRARQEPRLHHGILVGRHQFLDASKHNVHRRHGRAEATIALIGHHHDGTGLGDERVGSGNPHPGIKEGLADFVASNRNLLGYVVCGHWTAEGRRHVRADLLPGQMHCRHDHVARPLVADLHQPLAKVGFDRDDALRLRNMVELDLFAHHRLRLGDELHIMAPGQVEDDAICVLGVLGVVHRCASSLGCTLELRRYPSRSAVTADFAAFMRWRSWSKSTSPMARSRSARQACWNRVRLALNCGFSTARSSTPGNSEEGSALGIPSNADVGCVTQGPI